MTSPSSKSSSDVFESFEYFYSFFIPFDFKLTPGTFYAGIELSSYFILPIQLFAYFLHALSTSPCTISLTLSTSSAAPEISSLSIFS